MRVDGQPMSGKFWTLIIPCIFAISIPAVRMANAASTGTAISAEAKTEAWQQAACDQRLLPQTAEAKTFRIDRQYDLVALAGFRGACNFAYLFFVVSRNAPRIAR